MNYGSFVRLRPERPNHDWSDDFVEARTHDGRKFGMLNLIDEFTRECLTIRIDPKLLSSDVVEVLSDQFVLRGVPAHIRSDNGPEFIAAVGAKTAHIEPGSPRENSYRESFNSKLRNGLLNGEISYSLAEAQIVIATWRRHYNTRRPHSSLGYRPLAPQAEQWPDSPLGPASPATPAVAPRPVMHYD